MQPNEQFRIFRRELAAEGFMRRTPGRLIRELALFVFVTLFGIGLLLYSDHLVVNAIAMWLITLAGMGVSTNAHTASHNAASK